MASLSGGPLATAGLDAVALKPGEVDLRRAADLDVDTLTVDFEGQEHVPDPALLAELAAAARVRMTVPVRADGFDPLGDDSRCRALPEAVGQILVAGHPAYLSPEERQRAVAPRLAAASETARDPWVGTESVERLALAVGGTQFELLGARTVQDVRAIRTAGFTGEIAVYAPMASTDDADAVLDAVGAYAARRAPVREALPVDAPRDSSVGGEARETLLQACHEYALVGDPETIADRVGELEAAGVDHVVAYPTRGLDPLLSE